MPGVKRQREIDARDGSDEESRPARKQKASHIAQLSKLYNDLADTSADVRLSAATQLVKHATQEKESADERLKVAFDRLVKGLCSSRKAARLGFSIALAEILRSGFASKTFDVDGSVKRIIQLTQVADNASGQEQRDVLIGRRFAFHAMLQSNIFSDVRTTDVATRSFVNAVAQLSRQRPWLRRECGAMLYDFLSTLVDHQNPVSLPRILAEVWHEQKLWKSPEGVALWLALSRIKGVELPKHVWHKQDPLSAKDCLTLGKAMKEVPEHDDEAQASGARQIIPSFAWTVVLKEFNRRSTSDFEAFWSDVVSNGFFRSTSSNERKYFGLQVITLALTTVHAEHLHSVLSHEVVGCVVNHSAAKGFLSEAAKPLLSQAIVRAREEPSTTITFIKVFLNHSGVHFDQITKTKTIEALAEQASPETLHVLANLLRMMMQPTGHHHDYENASHSERAMADFIVNIVRSQKASESIVDHKNGRLWAWAAEMLDILVDESYGPSSDVQASASNRSSLQSKLVSCLAHFLTISVDIALNAAQHTIETIARVDGDVLQHESLKKAMVRISDPKWASDKRSSSEGKAAQKALKLLLAMTIIQACNADDDAFGVLEDTILSVEASNTSAQSSTVLAEIVLGYISKPSRVYKQLGEHVFGSIAGTMTAESLQSLYDILAGRESLGGQQELFENGEEMSEAEEPDDIADDVEEDSDVEISNGIANHNRSAVESSNSDVSDVEDSGSDSDDSSVDADESQAAIDEDEEAAFDKKLAQALGGAALKEDEDEDGSDMDDEQMMELEPHLAKVFTERRKKTNTKQDQREAKENIITFKSRTMDLLSIYIKTAYQNDTALSMLLPLCRLIRTTSSKNLSDKASNVLKQYFDICNKNKFTLNVDRKAELFEVLASIHDEAILGVSKQHTYACSRCSLFIVKAIVAKDRAKYRKVAKIYAELQTKWYSDPEIKMQGSIFTEWTSWSLSTRKY